MNIPDRLFITLQYCLPQKLLSRMVGMLAECRSPWLKNLLIKAFIARYKVNMDEAQHAEAEDYVNFNEFFTRSLKPDSRQLDTTPNSIVSPADGLISEAGSIQGDMLLQAKGQHYRLKSLLGGDAKLASDFTNGKFATIYLSPRDYHRVHMPSDGILRKSIYVPGKLFSVNQATANHVPDLFARNERLVCVFDGPTGSYAIILVGAMIVGGIETVWGGQVAPPGKTACITDYASAIELLRGAEMGRFKLGSTVILLFGGKSVQWHEQIKAGQNVRVGEAIAALQPA